MMREALWAGQKGLRWAQAFLRATASFSVRVRKSSCAAQRGHLVWVDVKKFVVAERFICLFS